MSTNTAAVRRKTRNNGKTIMTTTTGVAEALSLKFPGTSTDASNSKRNRPEGGATSELQTYKQSLMTSSSYKLLPPPTGSLSIYV